ncbi:MAG TPA: PAS domain S-box protein, partial [archaeon]|nr:PAS domain S-box protein [archaeon]
MASISEDNFNPEEDLLGTLDDLDIGFVKVSNDDIILNHNLTFNKIFGYDPEKNLIGTKTLDYWLNPEERNKFREILFKNGIVKKFIAPAKKVDGEKIFLEITIKLIKNSNGEIISSEGTFVDVTERIETEQKLRESEEKYRLITENANDLIAVLDDGLKYKYVNKGYELLGYSKEEIYNSQVTDLLHPDDVKRAIKAFRKGLTSGTGLEELRIKHKDGKFFWFEVKGKTFKDLNGETNALLVSRDITERKQIEQG